MKYVDTNTQILCRLPLTLSLSQFSWALNTETRGRGVDVVSILPAYVTSNMSGNKKPTLMSPSAFTFAETVWAKFQKGQRAQILPYIPHSVQDILSTGLLPDRLLEYTYLDQMEKNHLKKLQTASKDR